MHPSYSSAQAQYSHLSVDVESALDILARTSISLHCWQGDDLGGFENLHSSLSGSGLATTGNYPGKPRTPSEFRADLDKALSLIPGRHRLNLHACYCEDRPTGMDRDTYTAQQFQGWIDWAKERQIGLDFNPTCFSHPLAADGFTLAHQDQSIRKFWINHCKASRQIGLEMGYQLGSPCVVNIWVPDGYKDIPADRLSPRQRLKDSLDEIYSEELDPRYILDSVESKLFGIGSESYVVGSHEFYLGYAIQKQKLLCLDSGHFHPTESIADKISSVLLYVPAILLHVSRGVRWDSDHVVLFDDATRNIMEEVVRSNSLSRIHIGLDFFDASINRVAAWVIGTRNVQKAILQALLQPITLLREMENKGDFTGRLALMEESKSLPFEAIWNAFCDRQEVESGFAWMDQLRTYESEVLLQRK